LQVTLPLAALALCWAMLVAIPLGVFAAWKQGSRAIGASWASPRSASPYRFLVRYRAGAAVRRDLAALSAGGFPAGRPAEIGARAGPAGLVAVTGRDRDPGRVTRSAMLDTLREDYVRTARAKGAPERIVLFRHALRNALIPVTRWPA